MVFMRGSDSCQSLPGWMPGSGETGNGLKKERKNSEDIGGGGLGAWLSIKKDMHNLFLLFFGIRRSPWFEDYSYL